MRYTREAIYQTVESIGCVKSAQAREATHFLVSRVLRRNLTKRVGVMRISGGITHPIIAPFMHYGTPVSCALSCAFPVAFIAASSRRALAKRETAAVSRGYILGYPSLRRLSSALYSKRARSYVYFLRVITTDNLYRYIEPRPRSAGGMRNLARRHTAICITRHNSSRSC